MPACGPACRSCSAGSVRDDGPLPDTMTDVAEAADAMRAQVPGVQVALMLATTLHAIATGNVLPASVETFCVDINQAVVTKLADRGSHQAVGIVTDIGVFIRQLTDELCGRDRSSPGAGASCCARPATSACSTRSTRGCSHGVAVDVDVALEQWEGLHDALLDAGAEVETIDQPEGVPDLVFTANAGLLDAGTPALRALPLPPPRAGARDRGLRLVVRRRGAGTIRRLPADVVHEGAGDALPFAGELLSGLPPPLRPGRGPALADLLDVPVRTVELVDERLYHLDLTFCPLDDRRAMCAPLGWDAVRPQGGRGPGARAAVARPTTRRWRSAPTPSSWATSIHMPTCPPRVGRQLEAWGFHVVVCPVDEFLKSGGGCRCLTFALDVALTAPVER